MRGFLVVAALVGVVAGAGGGVARAQGTGADAAAVLQAVADRYRTATSYHVEAVRETRTTTDLSNNWYKEVLRAEMMPGNRYRYEGLAGVESGVVISDGTTEWNYFRSYGQYVKGAPHTFWRNGQLPQDARPEMDARAMIINGALISATHFLKAAHYLPDETLMVNGHAVRCTVVEYGTADMVSKRMDGVTEKNTFWINSKNLTLLKMLDVTDSTFLYNHEKMPDAKPIKRHTEVETKFTVVSLGEPVAAADFVFSPPADAQLVDAVPQQSDLQRRTRPPTKAMVASGPITKSDTKAMELLNAVADHYAKLTSYEIEAVVTTRNHTELLDNQQKEILRAEMAPGNRYRFEGREATSSGVVISDGTTEWNYFRNAGQYVKEALGSYKKLTGTYLQDYQPELGASRLVESVPPYLDKIVNTAHMLPDETVTVNGHAVKCAVVEYGSDDYIRDEDANATWKNTFWIDKDKLTVVKQRDVRYVKTPYNPEKMPDEKPVVQRFEREVLYTRMSLDGPVVDADFVFSAPTDAQLVESLPTMMDAYPARPRVVGRPPVSAVPRVVEKAPPPAQ